MVSRRQGARYDTADAASPLVGQMLAWLFRMLPDGRKGYKVTEVTDLTAREARGTPRPAMKETWRKLDEKGE